MSRSFPSSGESMKEKVHSVASESSKEMFQCDETGAKRIEQSDYHRNFAACNGN